MHPGAEAPGDTQKGTTADCEDRWKGDVDLRGKQAVVFVFEQKVESGQGHSQPHHLIY